RVENLRRHSSERKLGPRTAPARVRLLSRRGPPNRIQDGYRLVVGRIVQRLLRRVRNPLREAGLARVGGQLEIRYAGTAEFVERLRAVQEECDPLLQVDAGESVVSHDRLGEIRIDLGLRDSMLLQGSPNCLPVEVRRIAGDPPDRRGL